MHTENYLFEKSNSIKVRINDCVRDCLECSCTCGEMIGYCLERGVPYADQDFVQLLMDCAEICQLNTNLLIRGSHRYLITSRACAEICKQCVDMCDQLIADEKLRRCKNILSRCVDSCQRLSDVPLAAAAGF